jgi:hypothetical protein
MNPIFSLLGVGEALGFAALQPQTQARWQVPTTWQLRVFSFLHALHH